MPFEEFPRQELEQSIPQRFERQAARHADRPAVRSCRHKLTYAGLNHAANRIARAILARRGPGEEPVALLLANDAPIIAAMLGVLKCGKIYVPLDPTTPQQRIAAVLADSGVGLVVSDSGLRSRAPTGIDLLDIDDLPAGISGDNLDLTVSPDTPCWILYTSGTTGEPKGVVQTHRNIVHYVRNYTNGLRLAAEDRLSMLFSCSFNGGNHEIYSALLTGASLHFWDARSRGVEGLAAWLLEEELTIYCSVPTLFRQFVRTLGPGPHFPSLRLLKLVGEPVYRRDVDAYKQYFSDRCVLVNRLGATEIGTSRWFFVDKRTAIEGNLCPAGYAVEDNEILLWDEDGRAVGCNQAGEIVVRSRYLSPGYWRNPERTQQVFLPDPAGGAERLYRTGDLGVLRPDGCLFHLGRRDLQVKVRGHRVETAEVEEALLGLAGVLHAVVTAREARDGGQTLVAYVVPRAGAGPTVSALRRGLAERLPDFMIPSSFVLLEKFPLTTGGKIDRRALPPPGSARPPLDTPWVAPRTPLEERLAALWSEVLDVEPIGIDDHFLDLGGHSLQAAQVVGRIRSAFHVELPVSALFETPTVAALAQLLTGHLGEGPA